MTQAPDNGSAGNNPQGLVPVGRSNTYDTNNRPAKNIACSYANQPGNYPGGEFLSENLKISIFPHRLADKSYFEHLLCQYPEKTRHFLLALDEISGK
jgi:hypothetical protein